MKTIKQIENQISQLVDEIESLEKGKVQKDLNIAKRLRKKLAELNEFKFFLKTNPTEEFLRSEKERLMARMAAIDKEYTPLNPDEVMLSLCKQHRKDFDKIWDVEKIKKQLAAIEFLL